MAKDVWFFIAFFGILLILAFSTQDGGLFEGVGTATSTQTTTGTTTLTAYPTENSVGTSTDSTPTLTPKEVEYKIAQIYRELDTLTEELRVAKLQEPISPYAGYIALTIGNARETNPNAEYLIMRAYPLSTSTFNISHWYLQSYVTGERAALPQGDRVIERWRSPRSTDIFLEPGEEAYIKSSESPLNASFRENMCTGYIAQDKAIYPHLINSCPQPENEMRRFAQIPLDDDSCYNFIKQLSPCTTPEDDAVDDADLSRACTTLIDTTFSYDRCVARHRNDPYFDDPGTWHIDLEEDDDLWRKEREIIRLMDENDHVIDVLEY